MMGDLTFKATGLGSFEPAKQQRNFDLTAIEKDEQMISSLKLKHSMQADGGTLNSSYASSAFKGGDGLGEHIVPFYAPEKPSLFKPSERTIIPVIKFSNQGMRQPSPLAAPRPAFVATKVAPAGAEVSATNHEIDLQITEVPVVDSRKVHIEELESPFQKVKQKGNFRLASAGEYISNHNMEERMFLQPDNIASIMNHEKGTSSIAAMHKLGSSYLPQTQPQLVIQPVDESENSHDMLAFNLNGPRVSEMEGSRWQQLTAKSKGEGFNTEGGASNRVGSIDLRGAYPGDPDVTATKISGRISIVLDKQVVLDQIVKAIYDADVDWVTKILERCDESEVLNQLDHRGFHPVMLTVRLAYKDPDRYYDILLKLLEVGADPRMKDAQGWTALEEALTNENIKFSSLLFDYMCYYKTKIMEANQDRLGAMLRNLPDYHILLKWDFDTSVIPLLSHFAPSDIFKIWKVGSSLRLDSTIAGYKNLSTKRRPMSSHSV